MKPIIIQLPSTRPLTFAEYLINTARRFLKAKGKVILPKGPKTSTKEAMNEVALALRFHDRSPAFKLRAMFEEWSRSRLVQEMTT